MQEVAGLRPVDSNKPNVTRNKGRVMTQRSRGTQVGLSPTAAPVDTFVSVGRTPDVSSNLERLSSALSSLNPAIGQLAMANRQATEKSQMDKLKFYTEQFMKDKQEGAVTEAQVKKKFPEMVPTVAARVAEATGQLEAKKWAQDKVQEVLQNDSIRLNTQNRRAYLDKIHQEALAKVGDNQFYGNGFLTQLDRTLGQYEANWMNETANYHQKIQSDAFSSQVADALKNGGDLKAIDAQWKASSSLNNQERNALVVNTAIDQAVSSLDPTVLQKIPERFLNMESKAKLAQAQQQVESAMYSKYVRAKALDKQARDNAVRDGKVQILTKLANGEDVNPADYHNNPELFDYAMTHNSQPTISSTVSVSNAEHLRSQILQAGTTGNFKDAFANNPDFQMQFNSEGDVSADSLRDFILHQHNINPADKQKLIEQVPMLMDGVNFIRNPDFTAHFNSSIGNDLQVFARSVQGQVLQQMGVNVQGDVQKAFRENLRQQVMAYIEDKGEIPKGQAKLDILQKADQAATNRLEFIQRNYRELLQEQTQNMARSGGHSGGQMSRNNKPKDTGSTQASNEIKLPNGIVVKKVE